MFERNVSVKSVAQVIQLGETIEDYSSEMPDPSRLILGFRGRRPLHVVISEHRKTNEIAVITAYLPDPDKWNKEFTSRRS
jgi:hypothetical protein